MKKKLSMLLAASMITSMLPTGVFAASSNSLTNQPTAIKNSEWSVNYPDTLASAPQLLLKATSNIDAGEQVTLTLSDAEWAFYEKNSNSSNYLKKVTPGANDIAEANLIIGSTGGIRNNTTNSAGQNFGSATKYSKNEGNAISDTEVDNLGYIVGTDKAPVTPASGFNKIDSTLVTDIINAAKGNVSETSAVKAKREEIKKVEAEIEALVTQIGNSVQVNKDTSASAQIKYSVDPTVRKGSYKTTYDKANTDGIAFEKTPNATTGSVYAASKTALVRIDGNINNNNNTVTSYRYDGSTNTVKEITGSTFNGSLTTSINNMNDKQYSLLVLQSELDALLSAANKAAGYVNFYDVNYETYNRISFRLSQSLVPNDVIAIPVLAQVMGTAPKIDVTSARGNFATSSFQFATGVEGSTIASVNSKVTFQDKANLNAITISEASPGSFYKGNKRATKFTLSLPAGFSWTGKEGDIKVESNNPSIKATNIDIKGDDSGVLEITINNDYDVSSSYNSNVMIKNAKIATNTANAKFGDVKVKITGDNNVSQQSLVVATYATYGISLTTVTDVPSKIAGRNYYADSENVKTAKVVFEESVEDSWWSNRTTDFTVGIAGSDRTDLKIREVVIKVLDDVTTGGKGVDSGLSNSYLSSEIGVKTFKNAETGTITNAGGTASNKDGYVEDDTFPYMYITGPKGTDKRNIFSMNDFEVDSTVDNLSNGEDKNKAKFELTFFVEVPVTLDNADKELTVSLSGTAINEDYKQTVKVADIKEPLTFEYSTTDVNLDYTNVPLNPVTITENFAEGFIKPYNTSDPKAEDVDYRRGLRAADLKVLPTKVAYAVGMIPDLLADNGAPDSPTTGDVKFKDARVLRQSTESSKIVINPKVSLVRYIPEGKYAFTLANVDELGTDLELKDLVNVITAAGNKNTNYAQDVKIVVDGKTTEMIVDGKSVKMNAPAFIKDDRTMLPLRDVAVALGVADKDVIFADGVATVASNGKIVQATSGSKELFTTGGTMIMDTEAYIDPATSRMYLPISFVAAAFGISSDWDSATNTATLNASQKTGTRTDIK